MKKYVSLPELKLPAADEQSPRGKEDTPRSIREIVQRYKLAHPELYFFQKDRSQKNQSPLEFEQHKSIKDIEPIIVNSKMLHKKPKQRIEFTHRFKGKVILVSHQAREKQAEQRKLRKMIQVKQDSPVIPSMKVFKLRRQREEGSRRSKGEEGLGTNTNTTTSLELDELVRQQSLKVEEGQAKVREGQWREARRDSVLEEVREVEGLLQLPEIQTHRESHIESFTELPKNITHSIPNSSRNHILHQPSSILSRPALSKNLNNMVHDCLRLEKTTDLEVSGINSTRALALQDYADMLNFIDFKRECWYDSSAFVSQHRYGTEVEVEEERKKWARGKQMLRIEESPQKRKIREMKKLDELMEQKRKQMLQGMIQDKLKKVARQGKKH